MTRSSETRGEQTGERRSIGAFEILLGAAFVTAFAFFIDLVAGTFPWVTLVVAAVAFVLAGARIAVGWWRAD